MRLFVYNLCFVFGSPVRTRTWINWLTANCSAIELQENGATGGTWTHRPFRLVLQTSALPITLYRDNAKSFKNALLTIYCANCQYYAFSTLVVGITGFEPATSCSRNMRATKLRHIPNTTTTLFFVVLWFFLWRMVSHWASFDYLTWGRASGLLYLSLLVVCKMFSLNYAPSQCSSSLPIRDLNPFTRITLSFWCFNLV